MTKKGHSLNDKRSQKQQFYNQVGRESVALIDFDLNGSAPCESQRPIIDRLSRQFRGKVTVMIVDIDESKELAISYQITSVPTLIILKNGREVDRFIGLRSSETLAAALEKSLSDG